MLFFKKYSDTNKDINNDIEKEKWKNKYLDLIDGQEKSDKTHVQNQELLCKAIVHLSIAASGLDPQLEPYLQCIRDQVKQGFDYGQLKTNLDNFTNALKRLGDSASGRHENNEGIAILFSFLLQKYTAEAQQQALNQLQKTYRPDDNLQSLFFAIAQIINDGHKVETQYELGDGQTQANQVDFANDFVSEQLIQLLEQIEIPDDLVNNVEALKQQLENHEKVIPFEQIMDSIASLLIEINYKNKAKQKEFDKFLAGYCFDGCQL
jgi:diguanylate cyclase